MSSSRAFKIAFVGPLSAVCMFGLVACGSGGASGGSGGSVATGGSGTSTGGSTASGGSTGSGSGGVTGSGGNAASGGATATGGSKGTGGASASGGTTGTGGSASSGGATASTSATGGTTASGGATSTGGQTGTGGTSGGGSTGSGGATSGGGCIICDNFESSTSGLDAAKWVIDSSMGAAAGKAEIVSGGAHGSTKAVKVSGGYIKIDAAAGLFATVPVHFFMRVNMKFDMAQPSGHVTYLMLADKTKMGQLRIGAQNGGMIWNYDSTDSILPDYNAAAMSLSPPANEWHCFEFEIDGTAPLMRAWMYGTESPQMLLDGTATTGIDDRWMRDMPGWKPSITNFSFGEGYPTGSLSTWFDDIAVSASRIGCQF